MDFISTCQKSLVRLLNKAFLAMHIQATPQRIVLDMRGGKQLPTRARAEIVALVAKHPSLLFVVQVDETTNMQESILLMQFIHRLACLLWVYSFDCVVEIPIDLVDRYVIRQTKELSITIPPYFFAYPHPSVELVYNQEIGENAYRIASDTNRGKVDISLVLPERAAELPSTDRGWDEWKRNECSTLWTHPSFASDLSSLRSELNPKEVGYQSSRVCRIDQIQHILSMDGVHSCPYKEKGNTHHESIRCCSRICVSPELRTPSTRKTLAVLDSSYLRRLFL